MTELDGLLKRQLDEPNITGKVTELIIFARRMEEERNNQRIARQVAERTRDFARRCLGEAMKMVKPRTPRDWHAWDEWTKARDGE